MFTRPFLYFIVGELLIPSHKQAAPPDIPNAVDAGVAFLHKLFFQRFSLGMKQAGEDEPFPVLEPTVFKYCLLDRQMQIGAYHLGFKIKKFFSPSVNHFNN